MTTCRRGDIVLVLFPDSNLRTSKRRPALVVQANELGANLPQTIVAMITNNMARAGHPSRVNVRTGSAQATLAGLLMDSVIMTDNLATVLHLDRSCYWVIPKYGRNRHRVADDAGNMTYR